MLGEIILGSSLDNPILALIFPTELILFSNTFNISCGIYVYNFGSRTRTWHHRWVRLLNFRPNLKQILAVISILRNNLYVNDMEWNCTNDVQSQCKTLPWLTISCSSVVLYICDGCDLVLPIGFWHNIQEICR